MSSFGKACEAAKYEVMTLTIALIVLLCMFKYMVRAPPR